MRREWGRVLASLAGHVRDLQLAEDVLQDALVVALEHWPRDGVPDQPRAWLFQTARRKAIDRLRRDANFQSKAGQIAVLEELRQLAKDPEEDEMDSSIPDERLRLIFTCCHPALAEPARVALTLRTLGGLTTTEIARAFLVPETTMAQRLVRAKKKIQAANIPYRVPPPSQWSERLASVLSVIYLIFNEGYAASRGTRPVRGDLCGEAIRLGHMLARLAPKEPEAAGLLALMLLHDSRREARCAEDGRTVTLEDQDRGRWDRRKIETGTAILRRALARGGVGPYQVQAAISAVHAGAATYAETDWKEIVLLYEKLDELRPSPVVRLNGAVALSMAEGPEAGLAALAALAELSENDVPHGAPKSLDRYQPYHAARADMLRRLGRTEEADRAYRKALDLTHNEADRSFLESRLAAL